MVYCTEIARRLPEGPSNGSDATLPPLLSRRSLLVARRRIASSGQNQTRTLLRLIGPLVLLTGVILTVIGVSSVFSSSSRAATTTASPGNGVFPGVNGVPIVVPNGRTLEEPKPPEPNRFWYAFVGLPLIGIGVLLCKFGYMGAVTRYVAGEIAPVGKDVINYMADGTKDAVRDLAGAVASGMREGGAPTKEAARACPGCGEANDADAKFCDSCGKPLPGEVVCAQCSQPNDSDAKFCDNCGAALQP